MGDSAKPWSGNVLSVVCPWRMIESRFPLDEGNGARYLPDEAVRAAEAAPRLFAALCGTCPDPCDGSVALMSVKNLRFYERADMPQVWALRAAWSLLALTPAEAADGVGEADDGDRHD